MKRKAAFTLVELLVVIGIIALLISILLPTLNKARQAGQTVSCLSNVRQLGMAATMFAQEHRGYVPTCSDDRWAKLADPNYTRFAYRDTAGTRYVKDWASALLPYLGYKGDENFVNAPSKVAKIYTCPSDPALDLTPSGYRIFNNVVNPPNNPFGYFAISYGINVDITALINQSGQGVFGLSDVVNVYHGPQVSGAGQPLQCLLNRVARPTEVVLFADCGNRYRGTPPSNATAPLDLQDAVYYTTNWEQFGPTLKDMYLASWLTGRIPYRRHGSPTGGASQGRINVAFCDGHAETVGFTEWDRVRISPYR